MAENPNASPFAADYGHPGACGGMSLRDYFAGQALVGISGNDSAIASMSWSPEPHKEQAELAYAIADAMLAARTQDNTDGR